MSSRRMTARPKLESEVLSTLLGFTVPLIRPSHAPECVKVQVNLLTAVVFIPRRISLPFFFRPPSNLQVQKIAWHAFKGIHSFSPLSTHTHTLTHTLFLIPINPLATLISTFVIRKLPRAPYISAVFHFLFCSSLLPPGDTYSFISPPLISHRTGNGD